MNIKPVLTFRTLIAACFILLFSIIQVNAQERGIYEIENEVASNERSHFYDLAFKLHPTLYLKDNKVRKVYGEGVIKKIIFEDVQSLRMLNSQGARNRGIELIIIKLSTQTDLNSNQDLSRGSVFGNLKYVYIKSDFSLTPQDVISFITVNPNVRVLYKSENPSE